MLWCCGEERQYQLRVCRAGSLGCGSIVRLSRLFPCAVWVLRRGSFSSATVPDGCAGAASLFYDLVPSTLLQPSFRRRLCSFRRRRFPSDRLPRYYYHYCRQRNSLDSSRGLYSFCFADLGCLVWRSTAGEVHMHRHCQTRPFTLPSRYLVFSAVVSTAWLEPCNHSISEAPCFSWPRFQRSFSGKRHEKIEIKRSCLFLAGAQQSGHHPAIPSHSLPF